MSRGMGRLQRRVMDVICDNQDVQTGLSMSSLNRLLGGDRSNNRRAVRGLIQRGKALEIHGEDGVRRVILTKEAWMISVLMRTPVPPPEPDPTAELRRKRREEFERLRERYRRRRRS